MNILIAKLGAAGDVVRTTTLLRAMLGRVTWLTAKKNMVLVKELSPDVRCLSWEDRDSCRDTIYDLVVNLEDTIEVATFLRHLACRRFWGAQVGPDKAMTYTVDSRCWFDLSIISRFGRERADELKLNNRATYQELIFQGLGKQFCGETYLLPESPPSDLRGDVAIASEAGPVWPMKKWAYYGELREELEKAGYIANFLPQRPSLLEHLADVRSHRCLVSGDSLPMHLALGSGISCISIFTCTSPWEIYDYGLQQKIISPLLENFFYQREFHSEGTTAIGVEQVLRAVIAQVGSVAVR